jgi:hypothetical protein
MGTKANPPINNQHNLSSRVIELAHIIDRLPAGTYEISLEKQDIRAQAWSIEVVRTEKIFIDRPTRHNPPE